MVMDVLMSRILWDEHHCLTFAISPNKQHYQILSLPGKSPAFVTKQVCDDTTAVLVLGLKGRKVQ